MKATLLAFAACALLLLSIPALAVATGADAPFLADTLLIVPWAALVIGVYTLGLRWTARHGWRLVPTLAVPYLAAAAAGGASRALLDRLYQEVPGLGSPQGSPAIMVVVWGAYSSLGVLGLWMLFHVAPRSIEASRRRERERQELLREAERIRIRTTLEPHFVLNTLNAIAGLVDEDPALARTLIGILGDLLRDVVHRADGERAPVRDEIAWLQAYVKVLELRHAGRLSVAWHLDQEALGDPLPVMLLQPLVENAIQHGVLRRPEGGAVAVTVERAGGALRCTVADDGPGLDGSVPPAAGHGHGLELTRRRLALEAAGSRLDVASGARGTTVTVHLPVAS